MTGSIDDWFADRQNGSLGNSADDEGVEFTPVWDLPPENPETAEDRAAARAVEDHQAERRRNGLGGRPAAPASPRPPARVAAPVSPVRPAAPEIPWHLRQRIIDFTRIYPDAGAKGVAVELLRRGTRTTEAQVRQVLRTLTPAERESLYGPATTSPPPSRAEGSRPRPRTVVCASCGTPVDHLARCACS